MTFSSPNANFSSCHDYLINEILTKNPAQCIFKLKEMNSSTIQLSGNLIVVFLKTCGENLSRGILHLSIFFWSIFEYHVSESFLNSFLNMFFKIKKKTSMSMNPDNKRLLQLSNFPISVIIIDVYCCTQSAHYLQIIV